MIKWIYGSYVWGATLAAACAQAPASPQEPAGPVGLAVTLPLVVYQEAPDAQGGVFKPTGLMGDAPKLVLEFGCTNRPQQGAECIRIEYPHTSWAGLIWQHPAHNWGDEEGGVDLRAANRLSFWARGEKGGEQVEFKLGMIPRHKPFYDTARISLGSVALSNQWKRYEIPLAGKNMGRIVSGFVFTVQGREEPVVFYLDNIQYE